MAAFKVDHCCLSTESITSHHKCPSVRQNNGDRYAKLPWAVTRKKDCDPSTQFKHLAARRGVQRTVAPETAVRVRQWVYNRSFVQASSPDGQQN